MLIVLALQFIIIRYVSAYELIGGFIILNRKLFKSKKQILQTNFFFEPFLKIFNSKIGFSYQPTRGVEKKRFDSPPVWRQVIIAKEDFWTGTVC